MEEKKLSADDGIAIDQKMETMATALDFEMAFIAPEADDVRLLKMKNALRAAFYLGYRFSKSGELK